jgi:hypothetical protein
VYSLNREKYKFEQAGIEACSIEMNLGESSLKFVFENKRIEDFQTSMKNHLSYTEIRENALLLFDRVASFMI